MYPNVVVLKNEISREFPDFRLRKKTESAFMRLIGTLLFILTFGKQRSFMTTFTTTVGSTIYVPAGWDDYSPRAQCTILRHERVHLRQAKKYGRFLFSFLYLFCWLPVWRAYWRTKFEMEAYEESIQAMYEYGEDPSNFVFRLRMINHFTTAEYFWAWTDEEAVAAWFDATVSRVTGKNKN